MEDVLTIGIRDNVTHLDLRMSTEDVIISGVKERSYEGKRKVLVSNQYKGGRSEDSGRIWVSYISL